MKRIVIIIGLAALASTAACGKKKDKDKKVPTSKTTDPVTKPEPPKPEPPKADPAVIAKGAYVANVAGCVLCHTGFGPQGPDMANPYAGGLEVTEELPGGMKVTWRSPNITPDQETGIGKWTDDQVSAAIRRGIRPDDQRLAPMMPYMAYSAMSDEDVNALVAFLKTQKKVSRVVERIPLAPEMAAHLPPAPVPNGATWPAEKRGEYLATIMHCAMCHTPWNPDMSPDMKRSFAGGNPMKIPPQFAAMGTGTNFAANITSDKETGIGKWTEEQIAASIKTMTRPDGKPIGFPMAMYKATWSQLTDDDAMALAKYVKSIPPIRNKVPASTFKPGPMLIEMMKGAHGAPGGPPPPK